MPDTIPLSDIQKMFRSDPMSMQEHKAYLEATGSPLNPQYTPQQNRTPQGVVPIPKNVQGLADLLFKTGRARNPQDALIMAQYMLTNGIR